ncbi:hypothetical protein POTOM_017777 [Populus tomentosa]|uniref:Uncharacterized protein n=1 Tax=Populus tomentosa TaxID=118781 RepID=A0A8X8D4W7_POPTO|nr:hypothetical protein POTOM_017777 [Populus tomentosa]
MKIIISYEKVNGLLMIYNYRLFSYLQIVMTLSLDPNGNITVTFDIHDWRSDGYAVSMFIHDKLLLH